MSRPAKRALAILLCTLCVPFRALTDTVTLPAIEDSMIAENDDGIAQGTASTINSGTTGPNEGFKKNRALIKFDVSSIPTNATITSVSLRLTITATPPSSTNLWFSLHKVGQNWSQSAVTWTNRLSSPSPWSVPGGAPPADYSSVMSQSNLITGIGVYNFTNSPALVSDLQAWVGNSSSNFGWMILCDQEDVEKSVRKFVSRESGTVANRPSLSVQFSAPSSAPNLSVLPVTNGQFRFQFNAESNQTYSVEYSTNLATANWTPLTNYGPFPAPTNIVVSESSSAEGSRFYRVRTP